MARWGDAPLTGCGRPQCAADAGNRNSDGGGVNATDEWEGIVATAATAAAAAEREFARRAALPGHPVAGGGGGARRRGGLAVARGGAAVPREADTPSRDFELVARMCRAPSRAGGARGGAREARMVLKARRGWGRLGCPSSSAGSTGRRSSSRRTRCWRRSCARVPSALPAQRRRVRHVTRIQRYAVYARPLLLLTSRSSSARYSTGTLCPTTTSTVPSRTAPPPTSI